MDTIFLLAVLPDLEGNLETTHRLAELCSDINWVRVARGSKELLELSEGLENVGF